MNVVSFFLLIVCNVCLRFEEDMVGILFYVLVSLGGRYY